MLPLMVTSPAEKFIGLAASAVQGNIVKAANAPPIVILLFIKSPVVMQ